MAEIWLNVGFGIPSLTSGGAPSPDLRGWVPTHAERGAFAVAAGFDGVRINPGVRDTIGTPFLPPTPPTPNYSGIIDTCAGYAPLGLKMLVEINPTWVVQSSSWRDAQPNDVTLTASRITFTNSDTVAIDQQALSIQGMIDKFREQWVYYGGDLTKLYFAYGNEMATGGANGPPSYSTPYGKYDSWLGSPGWLRTQYQNYIGAGYYDSDAQWDQLATSTGVAELANIRGFHEICNYIASNITFYDHTVVGPAYEFQPYGNVRTSSYDTLLGPAPSNPTGVAQPSASNERATLYVGNVQTWPSIVQAIAFNCYVGNDSAYGNRGPVDYANLLKDYAYAAIERIRETPNSVDNSHDKPIWITEMGFSWHWLRLGSAEITNEERGKYWRAIIEMARALPVEMVGIYEGFNSSTSTDTSTVSNFGMVTYPVTDTGPIATSSGVVQIYKQAGNHTTTADDAPFGSWLEGTDTYPPGGQGGAPELPLSTGVVASFNFEARGSSGYYEDNTGTYEMYDAGSAMQSVTGVQGNAAKMPAGISPSIRLISDGTKADFNFDGASDSFTMAWWVKRTSSDALNSDILLGYYDSDTDQYAYHLTDFALTTGNGPVFQIYDGAEGANVTFDGPGLAQDVWNCVFIWYDKDNYEIGIQINDNGPYLADISDTNTLATKTSAASLVFGEGGILSNDFVIDEFTIWSRVLSATNRSQYYNDYAGKTYPFS